MEISGSLFYCLVEERALNCTKPTQHASTTHRRRFTMTESSLKNLTWATLVAGVGSALLLVVIGCVKPSAGGDNSSALRSGFSSSGERGAPQQRHISSQGAQRARDTDRPSSRH